MHACTLYYLKTGSDNLAGMIALKKCRLMLMPDTIGAA